MAKTNGNFVKYFLYKLDRRKSSIIIFAILNFLSTIMPCIILSNNIKKGIRSNANIFYLMTVSAVICMIMITRTTVKSLKIYHDRAVMDTLGCLPLSYGERFWGDLLSCICENFISLVPFSIISLIITNSIKSVMREISGTDMLSYVETYIPDMLSKLIIILIFVYIGIYAVTTFITSCCGKFGSSVLFSFVAMAVPPGIFTAYANYFFSFVTGADTYKEITLNVGMMPPFGVIFALAFHFINPSTGYIFNLDYFINQPRCWIVSILIIAAFIVGAYFIGEKRKAEKTGEEFMFKSVHSILSLTLIMMIIGVFSSNFSKDKGIVGILLILFVSFLVHIVIELTQNKKLKGFWKSFLRFAAVSGACFAFLTVVRMTNSFDFYKKLPSESSIKEVRVSGMYFFSATPFGENQEHIYRAKESVSEILSEHKKLLLSDGLETGDALKITYVDNSSGEFTRGYNIKNDDKPLKNFKDSINSLEEFDPSIFGVLNNSDFSGIEAVFNRHNSKDNTLPYGPVRSDKINELAKLLKYDLENNYFNDSETGRDTLGILYFRDEQSNKYNNHPGDYRILTTYKDTIEFLNDPGNYVSAGEETAAIYDTHCNNKSNSALAYISINVSEDDTSEYTKELLSYIEVKDTSGEYSADISIWDNYGVEKYGIRAENEKAAVKALLKLFREKYAQ